MSGADVALLVGGLLLMAGMAIGSHLLWRRLRRPVFVPPRAAEAIALCWAAMGMIDQPAPAVSWQPGGKRCGTGGRGYIGVSGICVAGEAFHHGGARVSYWEGARFAETGLPEELAHFARWRKHPETFYEPEGTAHDDPEYIADVRAGRAALAVWEAAAA